MDKQAVRKKIEELFEANYSHLRHESGQALSDFIKDSAKQQVLAYWDKLNDLAEKVTDTEVRLVLSDQETPQKRKFSIEGVVDIVKEHDETWMYDIKTHDPEYIRDENNIEMYENQLNVYAYIWQHLRGQHLNKTAIISTSLPNSLRMALSGQDEALKASELAKWEPIIPVEFKMERIDKTIKKFGEVVDFIEENKFEPAPIEKLKEKFQHSRKPFAVHTCRNCDARYSCASYREYAQVRGKNMHSKFKEYFDDFGADFDKNEWTEANLNDEKIANIE
jgi:hypothetical protein